MESSLADTYWDVVGGVGNYLGWGSGTHFGDEAWNDDKTRRLKRIVKGGLRQFYNPPPDQSGVSHQWSFLRPVATVTLVSGDETVLMPFDFKGLEGPVYVLDSAGSPTMIPTSDKVRARYAMYPSETGRPQCVEIEPIKATEKERGQRFRLAVWPLADANYSLQFRYSIQGEMLSGEKPYAYGGVEHAETILASCLAYAELHEDDIFRGGPKQDYWRERLATSISMDRQKRPQTLGYNADYSDQLNRGLHRNPREFTTTFAPITYNGASID